MFIELVSRVVRAAPRLAPIIILMRRGRPFPPGNKMGRGRPKGSPNKKTLLAQELFEQNSAALMALAINRSREDNQLLKMLVGRIVVRTQEAPMKIGRLSFNTLEDLERASVRTLQRATGGKISLSEAQRLLNMMEQHRRVTMTRNLERRTRALETDGPEKGQRKFQGTFEELLALYRDLVLSGPADAGQDAERT